MIYDYEVHDKLIEAFRKNREMGKRVLMRELKERFEYWEAVRGAYVMSQKHRDELKRYLLYGDGL